MQGPLFHQVMDPLLDHPQDARRAGKWRETAFPASYGAEIAKDIQNAFLHFPLRQITGCGGGRGIGLRHHVQRVVYWFMKVKGYFARHAAHDGAGRWNQKAACFISLSYSAWVPTQTHTINSPLRRPTAR